MIRSDLSPPFPLSGSGISVGARVELFGGRGATVVIRYSPTGVISAPAVAGQAARNSSCFVSATTRVMKLSDGGSSNVRVWVGLVVACPCRNDRHQRKNAAEKSDVLHDCDWKQSRWLDVMDSVEDYVDLSCRFTFEQVVSTAGIYSNVRSRGYYARSVCESWRCYFCITQRM